MAIDNSSYEAVEKAYVQVQDFLNTAQLGREHSEMMMKHELLCEVLEDFDVEALEEQTKDVNSLHARLDEISAISLQVISNLEDPSDSVQSATKVAQGLENICLKINILKQEFLS